MIKPLSIRTFQRSSSLCSRSSTKCWTSCKRHVQRFLRTFGCRSGVSEHAAAMRQRMAAGRDGVTESSLFTDSIKQSTAHPVAQNADSSTHLEIVVVPIRESIRMQIRYEFGWRAIRYVRKRICRLAGQGDANRFDFQSPNAVVIQFITWSRSTLPAIATIAPPA